MLRYLSSRILWGVILVFGGIALLLQNLGILSSIGSLFWAVIFIFACAAFFSVYYENHLHWWALIPAFTLLGMGLSSLAEVISPVLAADLGGALFLIGISVGFGAVFVVNRQNWWAVIPAGVLATLGLVSVIDAGNSGFDSGAIFFLGLGLTFGLVAILPGNGKMLQWAYIPAGVLLLLSLLITATSESNLNLIIPALLILAGIVVVLRTVVRRNA